MSTTGVGDAASPRRAGLSELLEETRILLPGTQVFLSILLTLPFTARFGELDHVQRIVFVATVFTTILALAFFVSPAAYHRVAWPVHHRESFKAFANLFLIAGLVPFSIALVLTTWLVTSVVFPRWAAWGATAAGAVIGVLWWVVPLVRAHDWYRAHAKRIDPGASAGTS